MRMELPVLSDLMLFV
uniref:Uncharacterized protein n=1 Tax=Rhizophora mucronata TaxID=61149 RepID=A0A2P2P702_RHIMU